MTDFTTLISGAGPAGLAAACLLAQDGVKTAVISPIASEDIRTTALMQPAINLLKFLSVWPTIAPNCAPLKRLHLIDDTGNLVSAPRIEFSANELELEEFGFNVPLSILIPTLHRRAAELGISFLDARS